MSDVKQHGPDDLSGMHVWLVLWRAARALEEHSTQSIARFDMGVSDFGVLEALLHRGPLSATELGAKVLLTSGSMTTAIDRLERRGLVIRHDDRNDRRSRLIHLTPSGRKLIEKAFEKHRKAMERSLAGFSDEDRAALLPLLRRLGRTAQHNHKAKEAKETKEGA